MGQDHFTVLVDGRAVRSCQTTVSQVEKKSVTTIEGLGSPEKPDAVQAAFIAEQACQCGYCGSGMVITAKALLDRLIGRASAQDTTRDGADWQAQWDVLPSTPYI